MPTATPSNSSKKAKKMPNYDVHAKHHFFMPNNFKKGQISGIWPYNANLATLRKW